MPNYKLPSHYVADGDSLDIYVNGTTSTTTIDETVLNVGNLSYDFKHIGENLQGLLSIRLSNSSGDIDTYYNDLLVGDWIVQIDSLEVFRGKIDANSFLFSRSAKKNEVSFSILSGSLSEIGVNFSGLTNYISSGSSYVSISEWLETIVGLSVNYGIATNTATSAGNLHFKKSDAGSNDSFFLINDFSATENRVAEVFNFFCLKYATWQGSFYLYERNQYSNTVAITESDTIYFNEYKSYKIDDYSDQVVIADKRFYDDESIDYFSYDRFITAEANRNPDNMSNWSTSTSTGNSIASKKEFTITMLTGTASLSLASAYTGSITSGDSFKFYIEYKSDFGDWSPRFRVKLGSYYNRITEFESTDNDYKILELDVFYPDYATISDSELKIEFEDVFGSNDLDRLYSISNVFKATSTTILVTVDKITNLSINQTIYIKGTNNFNGTGTISNINTSTNVLTVLKSVAGTPSTETSGQLTTTDVALSFDIGRFAVFKTTNNTLNISNNTNDSNPLRLDIYNKNTTSVENSYYDDRFKYFEDVADIYGDLISDPLLSRIIFSIKNDNIEPMSRIQINSKNYLIEKMDFDLKTKLKTITGVELV